MALRIFIADDDNEDIELVEEAILELAPDAAIVKTLSGNFAMQYLKNCDENGVPHLVILDYNIPEVSGMEILSFLSENERFAKTAKVVMSTSNAVKHINDSMQKGATKYFVKPSTKRELDIAISQMLGLIVT